MNYHFIDDFMNSTCFSKKVVRCRKKQSKSESTSNDIKFEILKLNEQIVELLFENRKQQTLAKKYVKILEKLVFKLF